VLSGRVRFLGAPPLCVALARRAWRLFRDVLRAVAAFRAAGARRRSGTPPAPPSSARGGTPTSAGGGGGGGGGGGAGPLAAAESVSSDGIVSVDVSTLPSPIVIGAAPLVRGSPHATTAVVADAAAVLELRPAAFARLARAMPPVAAGLAALSSLSEPHLLVACVPCLAAALADSAPALLGGADSNALVAALAAAFRPVVLAVGEPLFVPGDWADCAYVVASGKIAISGTAPGTGAPALLATATRGACVGESGLALAGRRSTRAVAMTSSLLFRISAAAVRAILTRRPRIGRLVRHSLLWRSAAQLVRLPLLSFLVGGEARAARLAPLADLFVPHALVEGPPRLVLPAPPAPAGAAAPPPPSPATDTPWDVRW
jgi:CRP-like cAMP-binding protein